MNHLNRKIEGIPVYDNLISGLTPPVRVASATIAKGDTETTYPRGAVFARSESDGKLYLLGSTAATDGTPDCILCNPVTVGVETDEIAVVYVMGNFNPDALITAEDYEITPEDFNKLRERGLYFSASI